MKQQQTTSFKIGIYNFITAMNIISHGTFIIFTELVHKQRHI